MKKIFILLSAILLASMISCEDRDGFENVPKKPQGPNGGNTYSVTEVKK